MSSGTTQALGSSDCSRQAVRLQRFAVWRLAPPLGVLVLTLLLSVFCIQAKSSLRIARSEYQQAQAALEALRKES